MKKSTIQLINYLNKEYKNDRKEFIANAKPKKQMDFQKELTKKKNEKYTIEELKKLVKENNEYIVPKNDIRGEQIFKSKMGNKFDNNIKELIIAQLKEENIPAEFCTMKIANKIFTNGLIPKKGDSLKFYITFLPILVPNNFKFAENKIKNYDSAKTYLELHRARKAKMVIEPEMTLSQYLAKDNSGKTIKELKEDYNKLYNQKSIQTKTTTIQEDFKDKLIEDFSNYIPKEVVIEILPFVDTTNQYLVTNKFLRACKELLVKF